MRSMAILLCCVTLLDCRRSATRPQRARQTTDMQTIDSVQPEPVVLVRLVRTHAETGAP